VQLGLEDKVVIVTGAASGMGRAMARTFCGEGARVFAIDRDAEGLASSAEEAAPAGGEIRTLVADLTKVDDIERIVPGAVDAFGTVDVLVNNAGVMDRFQGVAQIEDDIWQRVFTVNVEAPMRLMRAAVPILREKGAGAVVNVASNAGTNGGNAGATYTASKHALIGLTKNTAWTYATDGIRCNAIMPGSTVTNIGKSIDGTRGDAFERYAIVHATMPYRLEAQDIADLAAFLASDRAKHLNGALVAADGGWTSA